MNQSSWIAHIGFRPKRSCHKALKAFNKAFINNNYNWLLDADIKGFFDNVSHDKLIKFLRETIQDNSFILLITKFLKCDVMEGAKVIAENKDIGTPQGGLISPILANVFLHYVLDDWFYTMIKPKYKTCELFRYADDFIVLFENEDDVNKFRLELETRFSDYALELQSEKTKIINFSKQHPYENTFNFLGFTISNEVDLYGNDFIKLATSQKKLLAKKEKLKKDIRDKYIVINSKKIVKLIEFINRKLKGHYKYYFFNTNTQSVNEYYNYALELLYSVVGKKNRLLLNHILEEIPLIAPTDFKHFYL